ncbi:MAG TPA: ABC transporter permease, partial [Thermoanaerobaculia bacterium]|nr:ABC transporter permease [Thermoanaerobaculia bacterium]
MKLESRIARRYLWAARRKGHTAFLSIISMLGLAVGVATLLISIALLSGLQGQIKGRLIEASPQVLVEPAGQNTIARADEIVAAAQKLGMTDVRPYISGIGWGTTEDQQRQQPVRLRSYVRGHEPEGASILGGPNEPQIFVTRGLAAGLTLNLGDRITIIAPRMRLTPFGPVPVWKKFRITRMVMPSNEEDPVDAWIEQSQAAAL